MILSNRSSPNQRRRCDSKLSKQGLTATCCNLSKSKSCNISDKPPPRPNENRENVSPHSRRPMTSKSTTIIESRWNNVPSYNRWKRGQTPTDTSLTSQRRKQDDEYCQERQLYAIEEIPEDKLKRFKKTNCARWSEEQQTTGTADNRLSESKSKRQHHDNRARRYNSPPQFFVQARHCNDHHLRNREIGVLSG